jgi:uncharacterized protein YgiM (DUF1202 family)
MLLLASCAPFLATPSPVVTPAIPVTGSAAVVQGVEVQVLSSQPYQVNAIVRGQLPDAGCTTISSVDQALNGSVLNVTLTTTTDPVAFCTQVLTPFEQVIPLEVNNLPPGSYTVNVHGIVKSFELPARDVSEFKQMLIDHLNARNYDSLKSLMHESFMIGYWQSEGTNNSPEGAVEQLQRSLLNASSPITADPNKDLAALLGTDPATIVGADVMQVSPLFTLGWGPEGKDEAILFAAKLPSGEFYWHGLLFAKDGFQKFVPSPIPNEPIDTNVYPTNVQYVMAQQNVAIYHGPNISFAVIGQLFNGRIAQVIGVIADGGWWRIMDPDNRIGNGWVSAHPTFTLPTTMPHVDPLPPAEAEPTDVKYIVALKDVFIRSGPSKGYSILGSLEEGQIVKVKGISANGNWWQIKCGNNTRGGCWVSASPNLTQPTTAPHDNQPLPPGDARPTDVKNVIAKQDVPVYGGSEVQYSIIGTLTAGQIANVTGISADGKWWRILCTDGRVGDCWISTNPNLTAPTELSGTADVQTVEIQILESYPLQVNAIARGFLPDAGCTTISNVNQTRSGNTFIVTITTQNNPQAMCAFTLTPFEQVIPLEVGSLLPGTYIVRVNSVEVSFQQPEASSPTDSK